MRIESSEYRDLLAAAKTGAKWMRWWLDQDECECEYGHTCGREERMADLLEVERAIAVVEAALVEKKTCA